MLAPAVHAQTSAQDERRLIAYTPESNGRYWATKRVLPAYPAEALTRNVQGVVEVGIGITNEGRVLKVRVPPGLDPSLRKAAVAAAKQWEFRPFVSKMSPGEFCFFRLTFNFVIEEDAGRVELYNPPYDTLEHRRMRSASRRDVTEWLSWENATDDN